ncbi:hypothetical protein [Rhodococcus wratislaviensis]|uniref:hypothetical protein n=1 Tax=Rhodococcus wratislaviensis TaxID=44752 RepID=UPI001CECD1F6|nr:hypothetical protein [Rhodococcus wratislaviensis]
MVFERFSDRARRVVVLAAGAARTHTAARPARQNLETSGPRTNHQRPRHPE